MNTDVRLHMPHWMSHGRAMYSWYCCGWTQLMYEGPDVCDECNRYDCAEARAYRAAHIDDPEFQP